MLALATSKDPVQVIGSPVPTDKTHYRHSQLQLILRVFGVTGTITARQGHRINEVVNNRNAIAHGSETSEDIGQRYSRDDIWRAIRQMKRISLRFIRLMSECCSDADRHCR
jgi:hypothetical protein